MGKFKATMAVIGVVIAFFAITTILGFAFQGPYGNRNTRNCSLELGSQSCSTVCSCCCYCCCS